MRGHTVKITTAWLKATGLHCGLTLDEVRLSTPGEIIDLHNCEAIRHGAKQKHEITTLDEFLKLR